MPGILLGLHSNKCVGIDLGEGGFEKWVGFVIMFVVLVSCGGVVFEKTG